MTRDPSFERLLTDAMADGPADRLPELLRKAKPGSSIDQRQHG